MRSALVCLLFSIGAAVSAQTVQIVEKPSGLVYGHLYVTVRAGEPVERVALLINNVKWSEAKGRQATFQVDLGKYIRRLRLRAVGYDAQGRIAGEDEMVINDPRPPFRLSLQAPLTWPEGGTVTLSANVIRPELTAVHSVEFFVGETSVGVVTSPPYTIAVDAAQYPGAVYARAVARSETGEEANDVVFFGERAREEIEVTLQQIPLSTTDGRPLQASDLRLVDEGEVRRIEGLVPASDLPLYTILLIDYSESMLEELPVVKAAAKQFARMLLRPQDRIAVVGFNQKTFWLTGFTNDWTAVANAVDRVQPVGETHLYDSVIEMLYELQKMPGRHALVVLTDGVDQGSAFQLDHLVHYARYAGVPLYPVVKNRTLSKLMRLGIGRLQARRLAAVARDTGATWFIIREERELPAVYERIARELRQQYRLLFYSAAHSEDQWR
ncbi:MAG TPA: VWA domain-containing protein, partial [Thermoanaerobaculia bacterium]|nr:VWA domain-containing protein [Thermoanaerobaculia bacterium]